MKRSALSILIIVTVFSFGLKTAIAQSSTNYGHTRICGVNAKFTPALKTTNDSRIPSYWKNYDRTACVVRQDLNIPSVKLSGYCNPFPNKTSPVGETTAYCQAGSNEKANAYVCNTGSNQLDGCGVTKDADYEITNLSGGSKVSLADVKNRIGSNYKCEQTIQVDIFNKTCSDAMISQHYRNVANVPTGDADGDGIENQFEEQYFVQDSNGTPTFCLAKDALVWYTGSCQVQSTPNISIDKSIDASKSTGSSPYQKDNIVAFKIKVTNTGNTKLENVVIKDSIPQYTEYSQADTNRLNSQINVDKNWICNSTNCEVNIGTLEVGRSFELYFAGKVKEYTGTGTDIKSTNRACVNTSTNTTEKCDDVNFDLKDNENDNNDDNDDDDNDEEEQEEGRKLKVSKKVRKEGDTEWTDKIFVEKGDKIEFKIKVQNKSDEDTKAIDEVKMKDELPDEFKYISGEVHEVWDNFEPGDEETFIVKVKVHDSEFEGDVDKCVVNDAKVFIDDDKIDEDDATVCYTNVEMHELPATGASTVPMLGGVISTAFGLIMKRKYS